MWLININVRVKQYPQGWVVEIQKSKWYGKKYWIHIISVSGIEKESWYYHSMEMAIEQAAKYLKWDLTISTYDRKYNNL